MNFLQRKSGGRVFLLFSIKNNVLDPRLSSIKVVIVSEAHQIPQTNS